MSLVLYNTLTKKEEEFVPSKKGKVTMYTCGPTVYGRPHIGNYSSFLMADLLRRWLEVGHGYTVTHVKNITDVGHLVADRDTGEDKVEKQAREEFGKVTHESVIAIARKYEAEFLEDEKALNFKEPAHRPRATEYIDQMREMVIYMLKSGNAYITEDGIYFDVTTSPDYGKLSGNTLDSVESGSRVDVNEKKKHPADFALWKFCVGQNEHHALRWKSPGEGTPEGFPGWHIECSAMSRTLLGDQIDIHTGGEDNIFPHHECEIAQSEAVTGKKPFVKLWLHRRRIQMGEEKMSKSLGNVLNLTDIKDLGFEPQDLRYYLLSVHYRTNLKFTQKGLEDAHKARRKILEWMSEVEAAKKSTSKEIDAWVQKFTEALDADLNTPAALAVVFDCMTWSRTANALGACHSFIGLVRDTFGCFTSQSAALPLAVEQLLEERMRARAAKDFAKSDTLRAEIAILGYEVRDVGEKQEVRHL
jgi:cysteinyl-tRNA synthetase